jgi:hypothetical protein
MIKTDFSIIVILKMLNRNSPIVLGADWTLNIANMESSSCIEAKTCGCREKSVKIAYSFVDTYHSLCLDKRDIIFDQIQACERLLKYTTDETDKSAVIKEIAELKMTLDLLP